jgi:predicted nucleotide-binding protein
MGKLKRHRSILVHPSKEKLKLPSDLQGLTLLSYQPGPDDELTARLGPVCLDIKKIVKQYGVRTLRG